MPCSYNVSLHALLALEGIDVDVPYMVNTVSYTFYNTHFIQFHIQSTGDSPPHRLLLLTVACVGLLGCVCSFIVLSTQVGQEVTHQDTHQDRRGEQLSRTYLLGLIHTGRGELNVFCFHHYVQKCLGL